jgi:hypothetical protein
MKKKPIEEEIMSVIEEWGTDSMMNFIIELDDFFSIYDVDEDDDWIKKAVGDSNFHEVRIIRTVYLLSRLAENYSGKLCLIKLRHPNLWNRLEECSETFKESDC